MLSTFPSTTGVSSLNSRDADPTHHAPRAVRWPRAGSARSRPIRRWAASSSSAEGHIVGRGWTQTGGRPHAETVALAQAGRAARGATAYVTLEPCAHHGKTPPCADALVAAGVARVVGGRRRSRSARCGRGFAQLEGAGHRRRARRAAKAKRARSIAGFFMRIDEGRPLVALKMRKAPTATSPTPTGNSKWITAERARAPRPSVARAARRDPGGHRHGAGRRSGADLPPAGAGAPLAAAGRARHRFAPAADSRSSRARRADIRCSSSPRRRTAAKR